MYPKFMTFECIQDAAPAPDKTLAGMIAAVNAWLQLPANSGKIIVTDSITNVTGDNGENGVCFLWYV